MNNSKTPIVDKNTVWVGQGYNMYGKETRGRAYCKLDVAKALEIELNELKDKFQNYTNSQEQSSTIA